MELIISVIRNIFGTIYDDIHVGLMMASKFGKPFIESNLLPNVLINV